MTVVKMEKQSCAVQAKKRQLLSELTKLKAGGAEERCLEAGVEKRPQEGEGEEECHQKGSAQRGSGQAAGAVERRPAAAAEERSEDR